MSSQNGWLVSFNGNNDNNKANNSGTALRSGTQTKGYTSGTQMQSYDTTATPTGRQVQVLSTIDIPSNFTPTAFSTTTKLRDSTGKLFHHQSNQTTHWVQN